MLCIVKQHPHKSPHSGAAIRFYGKCKCLKGLAPRVGFEPTTLRLTAGLLMSKNKGFNFIFIDLMLRHFTLKRRSFTPLYHPCR